MTDPDGSRHRDWQVVPLARGRAHLRATLHPDGSLTLEGQDLGRDLAPGLAGGIFEYEYTHTLAPKQVVRLLEALGGAPGDDALDVVVAGFPEGGRTRFTEFFAEHGILAGTWTHFDTDD